MARLVEFVLMYIIKLMVRGKEQLTKKEQAVQDAFIKKLSVKRRKTKRPVIVCFIGIVGSGKSVVARELAKHIGGTVVENDAIRAELRKQKEKYGNVRIIAEHAAENVIARGGNVILDSDFADEKKRASIREKAKAIGARVAFIRILCDFDVMVGRALSASYRGRQNFFGGASSSWKGKNKGAAVKVREMHRRTPLHYRWVSKEGGKWIPRKFSVFAEIDTTTSRWRKDVKKCAEGLCGR